MKLKITKEERKGLKKVFKNFGRPKTDCIKLIKEV